MCVAEITEAAQDGAEFLGIVVIFTLVHSMGREIGNKKKKVQHRCRRGFCVRRADWAAEALWGPAS